MATETSDNIGGGGGGGESTVDAKILADLGTVKEKMDLCDNMLRPGDGSPAPSLKNNEALLAVIGFLEACAPRMVELVEVAAQGALSEPVLMECLQVNDRLVKQLADIDTYAFTETPAMTTAASTPAPSIHDDLGDLLIDDTDDPPPQKGEKSTGEEEIPLGGGKTTGDVDDPFGSDVLAPATAPVKTTGEVDDVFGSDVLAPATAAPASQATAPEGNANPKDDFDAFFEERTST